MFQNLLSNLATQYLRHKTKHDATLLSWKTQIQARTSRARLVSRCASTVSRALRLTDRGYCNRCGWAQLGTSSSGGRDSGWCELFVEKKLAYSLRHSVVSSSCLRSCTCTDCTEEQSSVKVLRSPNVNRNLRHKFSPTVDAQPFSERTLHKIDFSTFLASAAGRAVTKEG